MGFGSGKVWLVLFDLGLDWAAEEKVLDVGPLEENSLDEAGDDSLL